MAQHLLQPEILYSIGCHLPRGPHHQGAVGLVSKTGAFGNVRPHEPRAPGSENLRARLSDVRVSRFRLGRGRNTGKLMVAHMAVHRSPSPHERLGGSDKLPTEAALMVKRFESPRSDAHIGTRPLGKLVLQRLPTFAVISIGSTPRSPRHSRWQR